MKNKILFIEYRIPKEVQYEDFLTPSKLKNK